MSSPSPPSAPLEVDDPERARWLKAKIRDRVSDVKCHLDARRDIDDLRNSYRDWIGRGFSAQAPSPTPLDRS